MNAIALFEKEMEIENLELVQLINYFDTPYMMTEAGDKEGLFHMIFRKIRELLGKCKDAITSFFSSASFKKKDQEAMDAIRNNPKLGNQKVNIKNYPGLDKLNQQTLNEFQRTNDPQGLLEKYKKQRNALLAGAGITVAATVGLKILKDKKRKEFINSLVDTTVDWEKKAEEMLKNQGEKTTRAAINRQVAKMQQATALDSIPAMQAKIKAFQPFANACSADNSTTRFSDLLGIYKIIGGKINTAIANQRAAVDKLKNSKDESDIREHDKAAQKLKNMENEAKANSVKIESGDDIFTEGANADIHKLNKEHIKVAQKNLKLGKKYIKEGENVKAKKVLQNTIKEMETVKKILKDGMEDETNSEKWIGDAISCWKTLVGIVAVYGGILGTIASPVAGSAVAVAGGVSMLADCPMLTKISSGKTKMSGIKSSNNRQNIELIEGEINSYRALNYQIADEVIIVARRLIKQIENNKKFQKIS